jgi:hypothetical protein
MIELVKAVTKSIAFFLVLVTCSTASVLAVDSGTEVVTEYALRKDSRDADLALSNFHNLINEFTVEFDELDKLLSKRVMTTQDLALANDKIEGLQAKARDIHHLYDLFAGDKFRAVRMSEVEEAMNSFDGRAKSFFYKCRRTRTLSYLLRIARSRAKPISHGMLSNSDDVEEFLKDKRATITGVDTGPPLR